VATNGSLILLEFGGQVLALTDQELAQALERGRTLMPAPVNGSQQAAEPLRDADQMQELTGVPSSWWSEMARRGEVPCRYFGKYPRFVLSEVLECPRFRKRP